MTRRVIPLVFAATMVFGQADAFVAIPPFVAQPDAKDADEIPSVRKQPALSDPARPVPPPNPLWGIPLKQLLNTRERPIFAPSRRPPPPVVANVPSPPPMRSTPRPAETPRPQLSLIGTVIGNNESIGIFVDGASKDSVRLRTGEAHQGWVLRTVQGREITLENGRETVTLALPAPGSERPAIAPPPPAPTATANVRSRGR